MARVMDASWQDEEGNTYGVTCCKQLVTAGPEYLTFGGIVTNHLLHGFTRIGTPLWHVMFENFDVQAERGEG